MTKTPIALAATFAAGVAITLTFAFCDMPPTVDPTPGSAPSIQVPDKVIAEFPNLELPPCAQEDSQNCYWDATKMGNGEGTSFINWNGIYYYPEVK